MPVQFLSAAERERLNRFPEEIPQQDLQDFFWLSKDDHQKVDGLLEAHNRLGFALQLCCLRYLGFFPSNVMELPQVVVQFVAHQLQIDAAGFPLYGNSARTQRYHQSQLQTLLGYRRATKADIASLEQWLLERALEHDKPLLLLELACGYLKRNNIVRLKIVRVARMVSTARHKAQQVTYQILQPLLSPECQIFLDRLLEIEPGWQKTRLAWLQRTPTGHNLTQLLETLSKIAFLNQHGISGWDFGRLTANRINHLAKTGARATNQYLQRAPQRRRYPILMAFLKQSLYNLTDDFIEMFDQRLWEIYRQAKREFEQARLQATQSINEKLTTLNQIGQILLDPEVEDATVRQATFACIDPEQLQLAMTESAQLIRPKHDAYIDYFRQSYSRIRRFSGKLLETLQFEAKGEANGLLKALALVHEIHLGQRRKLPSDAPTDFIPEVWHAYIFDGTAISDWRYYELAALWVLRQRLRSGDVYLLHSRRFQDLAQYFIPQDEWPAHREDVLSMTGTPLDAQVRLQQREAELVDLMGQVEARLNNPDGDLREEKEQLILTPFEAQARSVELERLSTLIGARLPRLDITELLIEVDSWTEFSAAFEHLHSPHSRDRKLLLHLYACLLAQACNLELPQMAASAKLSYHKLSWCNAWYIRDDTLRSATTKLIDYHYHLPLSRLWGRGMLSSSDGQRFPVKGSVRQARSLPRYFGYGKGITFYSWTSDQLSQYGSKPIPSSHRDATYLLDEIENNETELPILELTTDTAGYTELMFALFDVLGFTFSPRIRDLADQKLSRTSRIDMADYPQLKPHLKGTINQSLILAQWDEILRLAGSIKQGHVSASLIVQKLQAYPRQHPLIRALQEYGRLLKTIHILRWYADEDNRRRINRQLNKGEALHSLRSELFFANQGKVRSQPDEQLRNQVGCLNLVTNAVIIWNTLYLQKVVEQLHKEGLELDELSLKRIWPTRHAHINIYGTYHFNPDEIGKQTLRNLIP